MGPRTTQAAANESAEFNVLIKIIGHLGEDIYQSINCTGTDNLTRKKHEKISLHFKSHFLQVDLD